jgi:predicted P-loop ATPase
MDQIRPSQQAELKQMLSKVRVNGRPIYGREQSDRLRFASFVATTNNRHPLRDRTGSRRFICIEIPRGQEIDNSVEIDYEQLYAQVLAELERGERYWFTTEETRAIQRHNIRYQHTLDIETMVETCFRQPDEGEFVRPLTSSEMLEIIAHDYPAVQDNKNTCVRLGMALQRLGYLRDEGRNNRSYYAIPLRAA